MAGARIAALIAVVALVGCIDPTAERTRRDFEEVGRLDLGDVALYIDPGVAQAWEGDGPAGLAARFRANAPVVELSISSSAAEPRHVTVRIDNLPADSIVPAGFAEVARGRKSVTFALDLPAHGELQARIGPAIADEKAPFHFAWVGDIQGGFERFARVREAINADPSIELIVFAGDLTASGDDADLAELVADADALERPWYSVIGNHDTTLGREESFQRRVGRLNYSFDYRGARFLMLDTASATLDERAWSFAEDRLSGSEPATRIVGLHVPPLDVAGMRDAGFASRAEGARLAELLASSGVDLLLAGHLHTLVFTQTAGVRTVISGNGGVGTEDKLDDVGLHYLSVVVDPATQTLDVQAVEVP
jgi:predicted phosphodiesterase